MSKEEPWRDNWELAFPSEYLGSQHLHNRDVIVTISAINRPELEMFNTKTNRSEKKRKVVINLAELDAARERDPESPRAWLCNKTNARTIAGLYGRNMDEWIGKRITLYPMKFRVDKDTGEITWAVRVRPVVPSQARAKGSGSPAPSREDSPPESAAGQAESVKVIFSEMQKSPTAGRIAGVRKMIDNLPAGADRDMAEKSFARFQRSAER